MMGTCDLICSKGGKQREFSFSTRMGLCIFSLETQIPLYRR